MIYQSEVFRGRSDELEQSFPIFVCLLLALLCANLVKILDYYCNSYSPKEEQFPIDRVGKLYTNLLERAYEFNAFTGFQYAYFISFRKKT